MKFIRHHSANVAIIPQESGNPKSILLGVYDNNYPISLFRAHYNPLGGNCKKDYSPLDTVKRELTEELKDENHDDETVEDIIGIENKGNPKEIIERNFIPLEDREKFKDSVIKNIRPFRDYLLTIDGTKIGRKEDLTLINSFFFSSIDDRLFYHIKNQLSQGKSLINEGFAEFFDINDLINGKFRGAWGCDAELEELLGVSLPKYDWIKVSSIGIPRSSFKEYKLDFNYERDPEN